MKEVPFLPKLTAYFSARPEIQAAYIFGSYAEGVARPDSDVDLAVLLIPLPKDTLKYRLNLMDETQKILRLNTEVIVLNEAPRLLQFQVIQKGKVIFERDPDKRALFEMSVASRYYDYKRYFDYHARQLAERIKEGGLGVR
jgi:hypothetical protein